MDPYFDEDDLINDYIEEHEEPPEDDFEHPDMADYEPVENPTFANNAPKPQAETSPVEEPQGAQESVQLNDPNPSLAVAEEENDLLDVNNYIASQNKGRLGV